MFVTSSASSTGCDISLVVRRLIFRKSNSVTHCWGRATARRRKKEGRLGEKETERADQRAKKRYKGKELGGEIHIPLVVPSHGTMVPCTTCIYTSHAYQRVNIRTIPYLFSNFILLATQCLPPPFLSLTPPRRCTDFAPLNNKTFQQQQQHTNMNRYICTKCA